MALELWRGPALDEFAYEPFAQSTISRLEAARLAALEDRTEGQLLMGRGPELVPELERLVAEHPLRERLIAGLMLALYRAGRQTEALAAYRTARDRMADDLGLEPGPELRELEGRILQHDPTLAGRRATFDAITRHRNRNRLAVAAVALTALLIAGLQLGFGAAHARPPRLAGTSGVLAIQTARARLVNVTPLPGAPSAVTGGSGSIWVTEPGVDAVLRIDPSSGVVVDRIPLDDEPGSVAWGRDAIWVASSVGATLTRIDPAVEAVTQSIALPGSSAAAVAFGDGRLWVADSVTRRLFEVDPSLGSVRRTLTLDVQPSAITTTAGAVWIAGYDKNVVEELDPRSGRTLARVHVGDGPAAFAFAAGSLWVANSLDATVSRIDVATKTVVALIPVGSGPTALVAADRSVWVANRDSGSISRIDPGRDRSTAVITVGGVPTSLAVSAGRVWAGAAADSGKAPRWDAGDRRACFLGTEHAGVGRPRVLFLCEQPAVHRARVRLAGHVPADLWSGRSSTRARPRALDPDTTPRRSGVHVPRSLGNPLLRWRDRAPGGLPPRDRATVPCRLDRQLVLQRSRR